MVSQLINKNGRAVANQFVITEKSVVTGKTVIAFQSYNSRVCEIRGAGMGFSNVICFGKYYDYSNTTMKHLRKFLSDNGFTFNSIAEIRKAIDKGITHGDVAVIYDSTLV